MDDTQLSEHYEQSETFNQVISEMLVAQELESIMDTQQ
jgi:hypothetical protein